MKQIIDNAAGPTGLIGLLVAYLPNDPKTWLIYLSITALACQIIHWIYRGCKWCKVFFVDWRM